MLTTSTTTAAPCRHCQRRVAFRHGLCQHCTADADVRAMYTPPPVLPVERQCQHCHHAPVSRPRGLCWACYYVPGVRGLYPTVSKYGRRGVGNVGNRNAPLPDAPTDAPPGSEAKVVILIERARAGQALWHPDDAKV